jgi:hypothetical protein
MRIFASGSLTLSRAGRARIIAIRSSPISIHYDLASVTFSTAGDGGRKAPEHPAQFAHVFWQPAIAGQSRFMSALLKIYWSSSAYIFEREILMLLRDFLVLHIFCTG